MSRCQINLDLSMSEQKKEEQSQRHQLLVGLVRIFTDTQTIIYNFPELNPHT